MAKFVLYLDQSYLSNLTKARVGRVAFPNTEECFYRLLRVITHAVGDGMLVCPISPEHFTESELAPPLEQHLYDTLEAFSCGVEFLDFPRVLRAEVRKAYCKFLGYPSPNDSWQDNFNRDPDGQCDHAYKIPRSRGNFSSWTREARGYRERVGVLPGTMPYEAQKRMEAISLIRTLYVVPLTSWLSGGADLLTFAGVEFAAHLIKVHEELTGERPNDAAVQEMFIGFLVWLATEPTPYIDVYSSMVARIATQDPERRARGGDLQDVSAASLGLPHCHAFTTDSYMKAVIQATSIDDKYGVAVYSPKVADVDRLIAKIRKL